MKNWIELPQENHYLGISLDYDGCLYHESFRKSFSDILAKTIEKNPQITKIILMVGSLRQSVWNDFNNATGMMSDDLDYIEKTLGIHNLSCAVLGGIFLDSLKQKFGDKIEFDSLVMQDIDEDLPHGTSFKSMDAQRYYKFLCEETALNISAKNNQGVLTALLAFQKTIAGVRCNETSLAFYRKTMISEDKLDISYLHAHHFAKKFKAPFSWLFIDDKQDILNAIHLHFKDTPTLLPYTCSYFKGIEHNPNTILGSRVFPNAFTTDTIAGRGEINERVLEDLYRIRTAIIPDIVETLDLKNIKSAFSEYHNRLSDALKGLPSNTESTRQLPISSAVTLAISTSQNRLAYTLIACGLLATWLMQDNTATPKQEPTASATASLISMFSSAVTRFWGSNITERYFSP